MEEVAIFWDFENCRPPATISGYDIVNEIRNVALQFGTVKSIKAYYDYESSGLPSPRSISLRSELQIAGVSIADCPHMGKKEVVDKMILVDLMTFALDHAAPATIVLISADGDFAYALSVLRQRRYRVVLIAPAVNAHIGLKKQATAYFDWTNDILKKVSIATLSSQSASNKQSLSIYATTGHELPRTLSSPGPKKSKFDTRTTTKMGSPSMASPRSVPAGQSNSYTSESDSCSSASFGGADVEGQKERGAFISSGPEVGSSTAKDATPSLISGFYRNIRFPPDSKDDGEPYSSRGVSLPSELSRFKSLVATAEPEEELAIFTPETSSESLSSDYTSSNDIPQAVHGNVVNNSTPSLMTTPRHPPTESFASSHNFGIGWSAGSCLPPPLSAARIGPPSIGLGFGSALPGSARLVAKHDFRVLVRELQSLKALGNSKPTFIQLGTVLHGGKHLYQAAGVSKLKDYLAKAEDAGIVAIGGKGNTLWVSLVDRPSVPPKFEVLVKLLRTLHETYERPLRSQLGSCIQFRERGVFLRAGVTTFKEYIALAEQEGIVDLGVQDILGSEYVALKTIWRV